MSRATLHGLSLALLFATTPWFFSTRGALFGLPAWAVYSLCVTAVYAICIALWLEHTWDRFRDDEEDAP